jgi:asparagine synthase (glutamine-hydrolysing)
MSALDTARELIDVHLSGWDGGTIMGGRLDEYHTDAAYRHAPDETTFRQRLYDGFCSVFTWPGITDAEAAHLFAQPHFHRLARESFEAEVDRSALYPSPYRADYVYLSQRVRRSTQYMIVFQRSAFEVRCPFFDYDLVELLYGLPEALRSSLDLHRAVITRRMPGLALIPYEKDNELPHSSSALRAAHRALLYAGRAANKISRRSLFPQRPRLYADYEAYLRGDLRQWAEAMLFDRRTMARGLFRQEAVRSLWERHLRGDEYHWTIGKIAPLITIESVIRSLIDPHCELTTPDETRTLLCAS